MNKLIFKMMKGQKGQVLPMVLISLVIGSLILIPSLRFVSTHLNAGNMMTENVKGVYAADAGIEDALWRSINDAALVSWANDTSSNQDYTYTLLVDQSNPHSPARIINGMTVNLVINKIDSIQGVLVGDMGAHSDKVGFTKTVTWDPTLGGGAGGYHYTLSITCLDITVTGQSPYTVQNIAIQTAPGLTYLAGSSLLVPPAGPPVAGTVPSVTSGIYNTTFLFEFSNPLKKVLYLETEVFSFNMLGPAGISQTKLEGFIAINVKRNDVGTVSDMYTPLKYTATATNSRGVQARIVAEIWVGLALSDTYVRYWQVNP